jgi:hypothetical protein
MKRVIKFVLAANLLVLTVLVFVWPQFMVGPGKLIPGHQDLDSDCFACHAPFRGADSGRCVTCHKPADVGLVTTTGAVIDKPSTSTPFHQKLISQDCVGCHNDHAGVKRFRQQGRFNHALLQKAAGEQCQDCHKAPADTLHKQISGNCLSCHTQDKWVPATFDHNKYFALDRDHNTRCVTCHALNDYSRYTCYGCHEHTPTNIRRKHIEEGIGNFEKCVECHRSGDKHDIRGGEGGKGEGKHGRKKHEERD